MLFRSPFRREFGGDEACNPQTGTAIGHASIGVPFAENRPEEWGLNSTDLPSFELRVAVREISCINMLSIKDAYLAVFVFLSLFFGSLPEYTPLRRIRPVALE